MLSDVAINPWLTALRFVGIVIMGAGVFLLAREQRVTVRQGLPARPWHIVGCIAVVLGGAGVSVIAITVAG